ncbi:MAG: TonB-dependent receptor [Saprospiraceae bacterium]
MKSFLLSLAAVFLYQLAFCQNTFNATVKDAENQQLLIGVNVAVQGTSLGGSTDANGKIIIENIPDGEQTLVFSYVGYETLKRKFTFPLSEMVDIQLDASEEELEEVVVTTTRSSRTIEDIPTRIETIAGEELDEKGNMNASNVSMLLRESTGIQVQQTSATSANANFRIQGLDGRYTQLLQNGFPVYSGFSSGLSIMQIPPLDLQQVEIIKGSASTLYGGGAIAGLINFIQKQPTEDGELSLMLNATSAQGVDLNGFYAQQFGKFGFTLFASGHSQEAYDPNDDDFSDIPQFQRYNINPRLFFDFSDDTKLVFGVNLMGEDRLGGDIAAIEKDSESAGYVEENQSFRASTQLQFDHYFNENMHLFAKNSVNIFDRSIDLPNYNFAGQQISSFSELGIARTGERMEWILGANLWTEEFEEDLALNLPGRSYKLNTVGTFVQNTWNASDKLALETGLRADYQEDYGWFVLPRISALFKISDQLSSRIGGGLGYKSPTIFVQEAETVSFRNVMPIDVDNTEAERSVGANWDINYNTILFDDISLSINQLFYYTRLENPLVLNQTDLANNIYRFENANGHLDSKGFETNIKLVFEPFHLFLMYSFIDTKRHFDNLEEQFLLTAKHRAGGVLMYEVEDKWRVGYEAYYTGQQLLENGDFTRDFITQGFMAERMFEIGEGNMLSFFINFENFTDVRLSRWQPMFTGTRTNPMFEDEIYAPTDGRIINGGIKLRL